MARQTETGEITSIHFPFGGLDVARHFGRQPVRKTIQEQKYSRTTPSAFNVRSYDAIDGRLRGGSRSGLTRYIDAQVSGDRLVQGLNSIVGTGYTAPGGNVQPSQSGRLVTLVAVSNGNVKVANPGDTAWTTPTNGTGALISSGVVFSSPNAGKLYFADGTNWKRYDPSTNTVEAWTASAGTLPVDSSGNKPRGISTWRGRTMLWGLLEDPQNYFCSAVGDPTNFDYSPLSITPTQAFAGNNSTLGKIGDVINAGIPFTDDIFIWGGDHSIHMFQGDPMDGGRILPLSNSIGMAWGEPWCQGPQGEIYFFSNQCGVYALTPGNPLTRISQPIDNLLKTVNTGTNTIRMVWDERWQGFHLFVTRTALAYPAVHAFYEARAGAWWLDTFANDDFNPLACCTFDGNTAQDRVAIIGSWDGHVRFLDPTATQDDGYDIASSVTIGPFNTRSLDEVMLMDMQAVLGEDSGSVNYAVHLGASAEKALSSTATRTGTFGAGRNLTRDIRRAAHASYVKVESTEAWSMEEIRLRLHTLGTTRQRGA
jgi:hypothetical protein